MKTILGKKIGMTQIFTEEGVMIPVSVIEAKPNQVIQVKTKETDGYDAVQIGYTDLKKNRVNKPMKGHFERWGSPYRKKIAEVRLDEGEAYESGQEITVSDFAEGALLDVTGTSKGKGTQGNIKRHGHHRGPMSHGSKHKRLPGALAAGTYPSRVFKGNDGPGRMGRETITVQNLELVKIIPERDILMIKGAVPGGRGTILRIQYAVKADQDELIAAAEEARLAALEAAAAEPEAEEEPEVIEDTPEDSDATTAPEEASAEEADATTTPEEAPAEEAEIPAEDDSVGDAEEEPAENDSAGDAEEEAPAEDDSVGDAEEEPAENDSVGDAHQGVPAEEETTDEEPEPAADDESGDVVEEENAEEEPAVEEAE